MGKNRKRGSNPRDSKKSLYKESDSFDGVRVAPYISAKYYRNRKKHKKGAYESSAEEPNEDTLDEKTLEEAELSNDEGYSEEERELEAEETEDLDQLIKDSPDPIDSVGDQGFYDELQSENEASGDDEQITSEAEKALDEEDQQELDTNVSSQSSEPIDSVDDQGFYDTLESKEEENPIIGLDRVDGNEIPDDEGYSEEEKELDEEDNEKLDKLVSDRKDDEEVYKEPDEVENTVGEEELSEKESIETPDVFGEEALDDEIYFEEEKELDEEDERELDRLVSSKVGAEKDEVYREPGEVEDTVGEEELSEEENIETPDVFGEEIPDDEGHSEEERELESEEAEDLNKSESKRVIGEEPIVSTDDQGFYDTLESESNNNNIIGLDNDEDEEVDEDEGYSEEEGELEEEESEELDSLESDDEENEPLEVINFEKNVFVEFLDSDESSEESEKQKIKEKYISLSPSGMKRYAKLTAHGADENVIKDEEIKEDIFSKGEEVKATRVPRSASDEEKKVARDKRGELRSQIKDLEDREAICYAQAVALERAADEYAFIYSTMANIEPPVDYRKTPRINEKYQYDKEYLLKLLRDMVKKDAPKEKTEEIPSEKVEEAREPLEIQKEVPSVEIEAKANSVEEAVEPTERERKKISIYIDDISLSAIRRLAKTSAKAADDQVLLDQELKRQIEENEERIKNTRVPRGASDEEKESAREERKRLRNEKKNLEKKKEIASSKAVALERASDEYAFVLSILENSDEVPDFRKTDRINEKYEYDPEFVHKLIREKKAESAPTEVPPVPPVKPTINAQAPTPPSEQTGGVRRGFWSIVLSWVVIAIILLVFLFSLSERKKAPLPAEKEKTPTQVVTPVVPEKEKTEENEPTKVIHVHRVIPIYDEQITVDAFDAIANFIIPSWIERDDVNSYFAAFKAKYPGEYDSFIVLMPLRGMVDITYPKCSSEAIINKHIDRLIFELNNYLESQKEETPYVLHVHRDVPIYGDEIRIDAYDGYASAKVPGWVTLYDLNGYVADFVEKYPGEYESFALSGIKGGVIDVTYPTGATEDEINFHIDRLVFDLGEYIDGLTPPKREEATIPEDILHVHRDVPIYGDEIKIDAYDGYASEALPSWVTDDDIESFAIDFTGKYPGDYDSFVLMRPEGGLLAATYPMGATEDEINFHIDRLVFALDEYVESVLKEPSAAPEIEERALHVHRVVPLYNDQITIDAYDGYANSALPKWVRMRDVSDYAVGLIKRYPGDYDGFALYMPRRGELDVTYPMGATEDEINFHIDRLVFDLGEYIDGLTPPKREEATIPEDILHVHRDVPIYGDEIKIDAYDGYASEALPSWVTDDDIESFAIDFTGKYPGDYDSFVLMRPEGGLLAATYPMGATEDEINFHIDRLIFELNNYLESQKEETPYVLHVYRDVPIYGDEIRIDAYDGYASAKVPGWVTLYDLNGYVADFVEKYPGEYESFALSGIKGGVIDVTYPTGATEDEINFHIDRLVFALDEYVESVLKEPSAAPEIEERALHVHRVVPLYNDQITIDAYDGYANSALPKWVRMRDVSDYAVGLIKRYPGDYDGFALYMPRRGELDVTYPMGATEDEINFHIDRLVFALDDYIQSLMSSSEEVSALHVHREIPFYLDDSIVIDAYETRADISYPSYVSTDYIRTYAYNFNDIYDGEYSLVELLINYPGDMDASYPAVGSEEELNYHIDRLKFVWDDIYQYMLRYSGIPELWPREESEASSDAVKSYLVHRKVPFFGDYMYIDAYDGHADVSYPEEYANDEMLALIDEFNTYYNGDYDSVMVSFKDPGNLELEYQKGLTVDDINYDIDRLLFAILFRMNQKEITKIHRVLPFVNDDKAFMDAYSDGHGEVELPYYVSDKDKTDYIDEFNRLMNSDQMVMSLEDGKVVVEYQEDLTPEELSKVIDVIEEYHRSFIQGLEEPEEDEFFHIHRDAMPFGATIDAYEGFALVQHSVIITPELIDRLVERVDRSLPGFAEGAIVANLHPGYTRITYSNEIPHSVIAKAVDIIEIELPYLMYDDGPRESTGKTILFSDPETELKNDWKMDKHTLTIAASPWGISYSDFYNAKNLNIPQSGGSPLGLNDTLSTYGFGAQLDYTWKAKDWVGVSVQAGFNMFLVNPNGKNFSEYDRNGGAWFRTGNYYSIPLILQLDFFASIGERFDIIFGFGLGVEATNLRDVWELWCAGQFAFGFSFRFAEHFALNVQALGRVQIPTKYNFSEVINVTYTGVMPMIGLSWII